MNDQQMDSFERAFRTNSSGCVRICLCGREFYDTANDYDWDKGELECLEKDPNATGVPYGVEEVRFENRTYVVDCDCWHRRAKQIIGWMESHAEQIARYLTLEKKRKQTEADNSPVVEGEAR